MLDMSSETIETVSELIGLSVAPVFMLAGIAGFLNVCTGRLARIIDRLEMINHHKEQEKEPTKLMMERHKVLLMRMKNINYSISLFTTAGLFISLVMFTMFLSALFGFKDSILISVLFMLSVSSLIVALALFLREIYFTVSTIEPKTGFLP